MYATFCLERRAEHTDSARAQGAAARRARADARVAGRHARARWRPSSTRSRPTRRTRRRPARSSRTGSSARSGPTRSARATCSWRPPRATATARRCSSCCGSRRASRSPLGDGERALMAAAAALRPGAARTRARATTCSTCATSCADRHGAARRVAGDRRARGEGRDGPVARMRSCGSARCGSRRATRTAAVEIALPGALAREGDNRARSRRARARLRRAAGLGARRQLHAPARARDRATRASARRASSRRPTSGRSARTSRARAAAVLDEALGAARATPRCSTGSSALWSALGEWEKLVDALRGLGDLENDPGPAREARLRERRRSCARSSATRAGPRALYEEVARPRRVAPRRLRAHRAHLDGPARLARARARLPAHDRRASTTGRTRSSSTRSSTSSGSSTATASATCRGRSTRSAARRSSRREDDEDRRIIVELLVLTGQTELAIADMRGVAAAGRDAPVDVPRALRAATCARARTTRRGAPRTRSCTCSEADEAQQQFVARLPADRPRRRARHARDLRVGLARDGPGHRRAARRRSSATSCPAVVRARMARVPEKSRAQVARRPGARGASRRSPRASCSIVRDGAEILGVPLPLLLSRPQAGGARSPWRPRRRPRSSCRFRRPRRCRPSCRGFLVARRLAELRPELVAHALFPTLSRAQDAAEDGAARGGHDARRAARQNAGRRGHRAGARAARARGPARGRVAHRRRRDRAPTSAAGTSRRTCRSSRAALLLTGDLDLAWRGDAVRDALARATSRRREWRAEMLRFAVSDEHAELRDAIGVCVEARS